MPTSTIWCYGPKTATVMSSGGNTTTTTVTVYLTRQTGQAAGRYIVYGGGLMANDEIYEIAN